MIDLIGLQKEYVVHIKNSFFVRGFFFGSVATGLGVILMANVFGIQ